MQYIHSTLTLGNNDAIEVTLDRQARVMLMDQGNYSNYRSGRRFRFYGGWTKVSPCRVAAPHGGRWHVVVDLDGLAGSVRARIGVISLN